MTTTLLRAPRECGSWVWAPRHLEPGLTEQYTLAARIAEITARHGLIYRPEVSTDWLVGEILVLGAYSTVQPTVPLDDPALLDMMRASRPEEVPTAAEPGPIELTGPGTWLDAGGTAHEEPGMVRLYIDLTTWDSWVNLEVFHDVWMPCDFTGRPHPEVYHYNAPRLTATITDISTLLGMEAEPGEHTYFGHSVALGIENTVDDDDNPLDVTDLIIRNA